MREAPCEEEVFESSRERTAGRDIMSVAAGITSQRILGASEMLPRHGLQRKNDEKKA